MMTNLHARSTPTRDSENPEPQTVNPELALGAAIRAGQSDAIAEAFADANPRARSADCQSAVPQADSLPPAPPRGEGRGEVLGFLVLGAWLLVLNISSRHSVEDSGTSALFAEVQAPSANALGSWLISAAAALSILALGKQLMRKTPLEAEFLTKKEFNEFRDKVDTNFNSLRDRIDNSHGALATKLDNINTRLSDVSSLVARLDERTKNTPNNGPLTTDK